MRPICVILIVAACGTPAQEPPHHTAPSAPNVPSPVATPPERRCLPVVANLCGCVYTCGLGVKADNTHWTVTHGFWKDSPLRATVARWCVKEACTDAFTAEILCSIICAPKPADPTCHFDAGGACVGAPAT